MTSRAQTRPGFDSVLYWPEGALGLDLEAGWYHWDATYDNLVGPHDSAAAARASLAAQVVAEERRGVVPEAPRLRVIEGGPGEPDELRDDALEAMREALLEALGLVERGAVRGYVLAIELRDGRPLVRARGVL